MPLRGLRAIRVDAEVANRDHGLHGIAPVLERLAAPFQPIDHRQDAGYVPSGGLDCLDGRQGRASGGGDVFHHDDGESTEGVLLQQADQGFMPGMLAIRNAE